MTVVSVVGLPSPNDFRKNPLSHFARPSKSCLRQTKTKIKNEDYNNDDDDEMTTMTETCSSTFSLSPPSTTFSLPSTRKEENETTATATETSTSTRVVSKSKQMVVVSFDSIEIREYPIILGDNPSPKTGVPITIGWKVQRRGIFNIDHYEANCTVLDDNDDDDGHRRYGKDLMIPSNDRTQLAILGGASIQEIGQMAVAIAKIQKQRAQSFKDSTKKGPFSKLLSVFSSSSSSSSSFRRSSNSNSNNNNTLTNKKTSSSSRGVHLSKTCLEINSNNNNNTNENENDTEEQITTFTNAAA